jgi:hypothetical protein
MALTKLEQQAKEIKELIPGLDQYQARDVAEFVEAERKRMVAYLMEDCKKCKYCEDLLHLNCISCKRQEGLFDHFVPAGRG